jgi:hypothetical protein
MPHFLVVPVPYTAHAVPPGCRAERYLHFLTSVLAEVPEADPDDAPVAVTATLPEGDEIRYRERLGRLVRPLTLEIGGQLVEVTAGNAQAALNGRAEDARFGNADWPFLPSAYTSYGPLHQDDAAQLT